MCFANRLPCTLVDTHKAFPGSENKWDVKVKELSRSWETLFREMVPNHEYK